MSGSGDLLGPDMPLIEFDSRLMGTAAAALTSRFLICRCVCQTGRGIYDALGSRVHQT